MSNNNLVLKAYTNLAENFYNLTNDGVYLIDFEKGSFLYVSDHPLLRCGNNTQDIYKKGVHFYDDYIPFDEISKIQKFISQINKNSERIPIGQRKDLVLLLNFNMVFDRKKIMVHHKINMLETKEYEHARLGLGIVSFSAHSSPGLYFVSLKNTPYTFQYLPDTDEWTRVEKINISENERTMLRYAQQGHSILETSFLMFKSTDTVKYYRRNVLEKLEARNITEAISICKQYGLL